MKAGMFKKKTTGHVMSGIGMIFLLLSAMDNLFGWELGLPPMIFGILFIAVGAAIVKKSRQSGQAGYEIQITFMNMDNRKYYTGHSRMATGITAGFALGAAAGIGIGMTSGDLALWLSVGVGSGLALGAALGLILEARKNKR